MMGNGTGISLIIPAPVGESIIYHADSGGSKNKEEAAAILHVRISMDFVHSKSFTF